MTEGTQPVVRMTRGRALRITFAALVIVYLLWNVAPLQPLAAPFRLFVTYVHEAGHSLAAIATGGEVRGFIVNSNGSGLATTAGGTRAIILPAGYIGAALFGALLFFLVNTTHRARILSVAVGVFLVVFTVLYARPAQDSGLPVALIIGLLTGGGLIALGWKASVDVNLLVLNVLAIMTALNAVLDVVLLIQYADVTMPTRRGIVRNDAAAFSEEILGLPPELWAFLWAAIAVGLMGAAVYYSILRPLLRENDNGQTPPPGSRDGRDRTWDKNLKRDKDGDIDFSQFT